MKIPGASGTPERRPAQAKKTMSQEMMDILRGKYPQLNVPPLQVRKFGATMIALRQMAGKDLPASAVVEVKPGRQVALFCIKGLNDTKDLKFFHIERREGDSRFGGSPFGLKIENSVAPLQKDIPWVIGKYSICTRSIRHLLGEDFPAFGFAVTYIGSNRLLVESTSDDVYTGILYNQTNEPVLKGNIAVKVTAGALRIKQMMDLDEWRGVAQEIPMIVNVKIKGQKKADPQSKDILERVRAVAEKTNEMFSMDSIPMPVQGYVIPILVSNNGEIMGCRIEDTCGQEYHESYVMYAPGQIMAFVEADTIHSHNHALPAGIKNILKMAFSHYAVIKDQPTDASA